MTTLGTFLRTAALAGAVGLFSTTGFAQMSNPEQANGTGGGAGGDGGSGSITDGGGMSAYPPAMYGNGYDTNSGRMDSRRPMAGSGRIESGPIVEPGISYGESRRRTLRNQSDGE